MSKDELTAAVNEFFGDTSRSPEETLDGLEEAQALISSSIEAIQSDLGTDES